MTTQTQTRQENGLADLVRKSGLAVLGGLTFHVEGGLQAGATIGIRDTDVTIGSGLDNDVVLIADDLAPHHARLTLIDPWTRRVRLEADQAPIVLADGREIPLGHVVERSLPLRFRLGTAECRLDGARDPKTLLRLAVPAGMLLFGILFLPSLFNLGSLFGGGYRASPAARPSVAMPAERSDLGRWQQALTDQVRQAGLQGQVTIERGGLNNLVAVGSVEPAMADKWRDVVKWYDAQGAGPLLLNNVTRGDAPGAMPAIRTVWLDANPQVVLQNGQAIGIGETMPGGWKIDAIEQGGVVLSREGRITRIAF